MEESESGSIVAAVSGLERSMGSMEQVLLLHGEMLLELLAMARERPPEPSRLEGLLEALVTRLDGQAGALERIAGGMVELSTALKLTALP